MEVQWPSLPGLRFARGGTFALLSSPNETDIDSMVPASDPTTSPLTPEQQQQFVKASGAAAKLTRASRMAACNGGSMLVLAFLCALYYVKTGRRLRDYVEQTPPWILKLQRGR